MVCGLVDCSAEYPVLGGVRMPQRLQRGVLGGREVGKGGRVGRGQRGREMKPDDPVAVLLGRQVLMLLPQSPPWAPNLW